MVEGVRTNGRPWYRGRLLFVPVLAVTYAASRAPLLPLAYGADADTWAMAARAPALVLKGEYQPSRFPGHPLYELLQSAAVVAGGPLLSNSLSLGLSGILLWASYRLARELGVEAPGWAVLAIAAHPLIWIASSDSSDFILAAVLSTSALLAAARGRAGWAGALLGLAAAARIETACFLLPVLVLSRGRGWARTVVTMASVASILFVPVLRYYGARGAPMEFLHVSRLDLATRAFLFLASGWAAWGLVAGLVLVALLAANARGLLSRVSAGDPLTRAAGVLLLAYLVVVFVHPTKASYFVPFIPLFLLAVQHVAPWGWRLGLAAALLLYAVVYPKVFERTGGSPRLTFRWNNGLVAKDVIARWNAAHAAQSIDAHVAPGEGLVILGYWLDPWRERHPEAEPLDRLPGGIQIDPMRNAAYRSREGAVMVHSLDRSAAARARGEGIPLAFGEGIDEFLRQTYGYDIRSYGARELPVRQLGSDISERFTLPALTACTRRPEDWGRCVAARAAARGGVSTLSRGAWARDAGEGRAAGAIARVALQ